MEPYTLQLKDYYEFSWVTAALNFFVTFGDSFPLGDCYYEKEEAEAMFARIQEEFLEYYWKVCKQQDEEGKEYCAFEDNVHEDAFPEASMVYYYDKEVAKSRAKSWNFCNSTAKANELRVLDRCYGFSLTDSWDSETYTNSCKRPFSRDEINTLSKKLFKEEKEWLKTKEGQEWINSDEC